MVEKDPDVEATPCRRLLQQQVRRQNIDLICENLSARFADPQLDLSEKANRTGELFPRGNFKKVGVKRLFSFAALSCRGRVFTLRVCRAVCKKLVRELQLAPAIDPRESWQAWYMRQAKRLQVLAKGAKRACYDNMDLETQPMDGQTADALAATRLLWSWLVIDSSSAFQTCMHELSYETSYFFILCNILYYMDINCLHIL